MWEISITSNYYSLRFPRGVLKVTFSQQVFVRKTTQEIV